jgi:hypothetical protein
MADGQCRGFRAAGDAQLSEDVADFFIGFSWVYRVLQSDFTWSKL